MAAITARTAALLLAAVALACHALLPFTDYVVYDDLYMINWANTRHLDYIWTFLSLHGNQPCGVYYAACTVLSPFADLLVPLKLAGVGIAFAAGWLTWRVGTESKLLTAGEALLVAAVAVAYPAFKVKGGLAYSQYDWAPVSLLLGTLLALRAEHRTGWGHAVRRVAALAIFAATFITGSAFTVYGGCFAVLVLAHQRATGRRWFQVPWRYVASRVDYLALPFVYYAVTRTVFQSTGHYAGYNKPELSAEKIETAYRSLLPVFTDPFTLFATYPVLVQVGLVAAAVAVWLVGVRVLRRRDTDTAPPFGPASGPLALVAVGLVLLVLGTFPYAAVGRKFGAWGHPTSYTPFVPLPVGLLLLAGVKAVARTAPGLLRVVPPLLAALGVCWAAAWWHDYILMQSVGARDRAVLRQLHAHPQARECSVYCISNRYPIPRTTSPMQGWEWVYIDAGTRGEPRSFAYNGLPGMAINEPDFVRQCLADTTLGHALTTIDLNGKQGIVVVRRRTTLPDFGIGCRYLANKYLRPKRMDPFLDSLVEIEFYPAPWDHARIREQVESRP